MNSPSHPQKVQNKGDKQQQSSVQTREIETILQILNQNPNDQILQSLVLSQEEVETYKIGILELDKPKRIINHRYYCNQDDCKGQSQQFLVNTKFEIEWHSKLVDNQLVILLPSFYSYQQIEKHYPDLINEYLMKLQHKVFFHFLFFNFQIQINHVNEIITWAYLYYTKLLKDKLVNKPDHLNMITENMMNFRNNCKLNQQIVLEHQYKWIQNNIGNIDKLNMLQIQFNLQRLNQTIMK